MELDRTDGNITWFKFLHNIHYRELQQNFWKASESLDHNAISVGLALNNVENNFQEHVG